MNSLQFELNDINEKLDLLLYRKNQLDAIIGEYSDVINRVKNLIETMQDANVEPSNLLMEIEQLIYCPEQEQEPDTNHEKINSYIIPFDPLLHGEPTPTPQPTPTTSNPEFVKLMALVPTAVVTPTPTPAPKTQLNDRAYRRGEDCLLIGFDNKKLMAQWYKWTKDSWGDRTHIDNIENLDGFKYCLSILWHCKADWERLSKLDYSLTPDNQKRIETDNFEYKQATETTTQIFRDGVLLGLAKNCDSHWESPQFRDEQFDSREAIADKLWQLINQF